MNIAVESEKFDTIATLPTAEKGVAKAALRTLAGGISVITAGIPGARTGATVTSATALSMDPPTMIVSINTSSSTWPIIDQNRHFCVNILSTEQKHIADRFAGFGGIKGEARYEGAEWLEGLSGAPVLAEALSSIECVVDEIIERHSHAIILGRIIDVRLGSGHSLVYGNGQYGRVAALEP